MDGGIFEFELCKYGKFERSEEEWMGSGKDVVVRGMQGRAFLWGMFGSLEEQMQQQTSYIKSPKSKKDPSALSLLVWMDIH